MLVEDIVVLSGFDCYIKVIQMDVNAQNVSIYDFFPLCGKKLGKFSFHIYFGGKLQI